MFGANSAISGVNNFALTGNKTPEQFNLFIVNVFYILRTKKALFFHIFLIKKAGLPVLFLPRQYLFPAILREPIDFGLLFAEFRF